MLFQFFGLVWFFNMSPTAISGIHSPWESFLRPVGDPSPYLQEFPRNHGKLRTTRSASATGNWTRPLPSKSFEHRTARPLVELLIFETLSNWFRGANSNVSNHNHGDGWFDPRQRIKTEIQIVNSRVKRGRLLFFQSSNLSLKI